MLVDCDRSSFLADMLLVYLATYLFGLYYLVACIQNFKTVFKTLYDSSHKIQRTKMLLGRTIFV